MIKSDVGECIKRYDLLVSFIQRCLFDFYFICWRKSFELSWIIERKTIVVILAEVHGCMLSAAGEYYSCTHQHDIFLV